MTHLGFWVKTEVHGIATPHERTVKILAKFQLASGKTPY